MSASKINVQTIVATDRQKAWDCYTQPEHITKWNFASDDWRCPAASNDMRVGGQYCARMEAKDGSFGFDFTATYDEVIVGEKFVYTMPNGRQVTASFETAQEGTRVSVTFDAETEHSMEQQRSGWQAILDNYKKYAEKNE